MFWTPEPAPDPTPGFAGVASFKTYYGIIKPGDPSGGLPCMSVTDREEEPTTSGPPTSTLHNPAGTDAREIKGFRGLVDGRGSQYEGIANLSATPRIAVPRFPRVVVTIEPRGPRKRVFALPLRKPAGGNQMTHWSYPPNIL